ncbi:MAG: hypothetical protein JWO99_760 [Candidatus Saccharibacteria bacterium]|nr:hypothetical protein [Candidatus Saccharibacteria bacterium]
MAISRISSGSTGSFSGSYVTGDLIVIHAVDTGSSAIPLTPSGYTQISSVAQSANNFAMAAFYKFATSASETYPTITSAVASSWVIYRGVAATPFVSIGGQSGTSNSIAYSGIVTYQNPGQDWVVTFGASSNNLGGVGTHPPTNTTLIVEASASNYEAAIFDSGAPLSTYGFNSKTLTASTNWLTKTAELVAGTGTPPPTTPTDLFFVMF